MTKARDKVLLTLTERMARFEITCLIDGKASEAVNDALLKLAQDFDFKSITVNNGREFQDYLKLLPVMFIIPMLVPAEKEGQMRNTIA